ncbi:DUF4097 family beta strand repeat-containing protein [Demequina globuliformis]|uniref:DUF4097 family beta strand repeat-containing protein n=1 Tax=Demequina globuliformis TaxID=676202 RepID=UPI0007846D3D|nr:DUF4097 family beta strand repeat-containing protein [Demequina globuliformis]
MTGAEITTVRIDIPAGRIDVVGVPGRDEVSVVVNPSNRMRAGDREAADNASVERSGDAIVVTAPSRTSVFGKPDSVDVIVEGPRGLSVDAQTKYGEIRLVGELGAARLQATYGAVRVDTVAALELTGGHGAVRVRHVSGDATVALSNGSAKVESAEGALSVRGSNGAIAVESVAGPATLETTNGSIKVGSALAGLDARTTHGSITLRDLAGGVSRCETSMGAVRVGVRPGVPLWLDAASDHGAVVMDLEADGGPVAGEDPVELHVRTGYGAVKVHRA